MSTESSLFLLRRRISSESNLKGGGRNSAAFAMSSRSASPIKALPCYSAVSPYQSSPAQRYSASPPQMGRSASFQNALSSASLVPDPPRLGRHREQCAAVDRWTTSTSLNWLQTQRNGFHQLQLFQSQSLGPLATAEGITTEEGKEAAKEASTHESNSSSSNQSQQRHRWASVADTRVNPPSCATATAAVTRSQCSNSNSNEHTTTTTTSVPDNEQIAEAIRWMVVCCRLEH